MYVNEIISQKQLSKYRVAKGSGIPYMTLNDICSGHARIEKCSAETLFKLAKVLNVTIEDLIVDSMENKDPLQYVMSFELFKSNVCHRVKDNGDIPFIIETLKSGKIQEYYDRKEYPKAYYLLAMVDYLSRENNLPLCNLYHDMRKQRLAEPIYPLGAMVMAEVMRDDSIVTESLENAIPEFRRYNIAENEVRNVI